MLFLDTLNIAIGPTGSGKSLLEMVLIRSLLKQDPRPIITTLAIIPERLAEYLVEVYGNEAPANIASRILRIGPDDLATFWRVRGIQYDGDYGYVAKKLGRFGGPDWQTPLPGVIYMLDELQVKFKAREFMKNSGEFLDYQPQARKLGDTIVGVSPASSLLDKGFRDLANQCIVLTNMYKIKTKGFTAPRKIVARTFCNCPPVKGEEHLDKFEFQIDAAGLASCYRTQEGVGVKGIGADIGKIARGLPWWTIIPIGILLGLAAWKTVSLALKGSLHWGFKKIAVSDSANRTNATALASHLAPSPFSAIGAPGSLSFTSAPPQTVHAPVSNPPPRTAHARGFAILNGTLYIDTRLGQVTATAWTNTGDSILANGIEWSLPPAVEPPGARALR